MPSSDQPLGDYEVTHQFRVTLQGPGVERVVPVHLFPSLEAARTWSENRIAHDKKYDAYLVEELVSTFYAGSPPHGGTVVTHSWAGRPDSLGRLS
jgi:hypothetical protein